jgi:hypothetical protein
MTRRTLFALLLAPLAKYLPKKADPLPAWTISDLDAAYQAAWAGPPTEDLVFNGLPVVTSEAIPVDQIFFINKTGFYEMWGTGGKLISEPVYRDGKPPFVMLYNLEVPWKST